MKITKTRLKAIIKEEVQNLKEDKSAKTTEKMRADFERTGKLPPHLQQLVKLMNKHKSKITNIIVPGLEWMADIKENKQKLKEKKIPKKSDPPAWHQHKIAVDTVKNPMKAMLGDVTVEEYEEILRDKFGYNDKDIAKLKR